nr:glycosyltransferase family 61 protein [uncultured Undibacterium sp.]
MYSNFFDINGYSKEELDVIEKLLAFDGTKYLNAYPDVSSAELDPLQHFLTNGMYEERLIYDVKPNDKGEKRPALWSIHMGLQDLLGFDEEFYKEKYPDVTENYFQHFIQFGMRERRLPFNFFDNVESESVTWDVLEKFNLECNGSLDRQMHIEIPNAEAYLQALISEIDVKKLFPKTFRNNFWLALAIGFSAREFFGAAKICYNFFYNYFLPMPHLNNWKENIYIAGPVTKTIEFARKKKWLVARLDVETKITVPDPIFLNRPNPKPSSQTLPLPAPHYCQLEDVVLVGGNSMIIVGAHDLVYDYLDVHEDDTRQVEFKGPNILHAVNHACTIKYIHSNLEVPEAFSLMHDHGHNYFHWLIEVLPRYLLARKNGLVNDIPLLIDEQIGKLQEEVMRLILGKDAVLIKVPRNHSIRVRKLHWISDLSINTVHTLDLPKKSDILISPTAVALLREVGVCNYIHGIHEYEKLLIVRTNVEFRTLVNRQLLNQVLSEDGFIPFNPGHASFVEQIRTFSNARIIVTEAGAAQANMVFCRPGTIILVLVNGYKNSNYFYLAEMAQIIGLKLFFFECLRLEGSHMLGVHDNMIVNISNLKQHISTLLADDDKMKNKNTKSKNIQ